MTMIAVYTPPPHRCAVCFYTDIRAIGWLNQAA